MSDEKVALVIDDDDIARELACSLLREGGYLVEELPSPIGATRILLSGRIDLVILDLFMPMMDGDRFMRLLAENPKLAQTVIILVSGASTQELLKVTEKVSPHAVVAKRELREQLVPTANRWMRRRRRTQ